MVKNNKIIITLYIISFLLIIFYVYKDLTISLHFGYKFLIISIICILMFLCGLIKKKCKRINNISWFLLYLYLIIKLTLFEESLGRNNYNIFDWNSNLFSYYIKYYFNIIPFKNIILFVKWLINNEITFLSFSMNIFGNIIAFMPLSYFLPLLFNKENNLKYFIVTVTIIVSVIELLQFVTLSGTCDIDDLILNTLGCYIMFKILRIKSVNIIINKYFV